VTLQIRAGHRLVALRPARVSLPATSVAQHAVSAAKDHGDPGSGLPAGLQIPAAGQDGGLPTWHVRGLRRNLRYAFGFARAHRRYDAEVTPT